MSSLNYSDGLLIPGLTLFLSCFAKAGKILDDEAITFIKKFLELTTEDNRTKLQALNLQNTKGQISYFHYAYDEREQVEKLLLDIEKSTTIENLLIYVG